MRTTKLVLRADDTVSARIVSEPRAPKRAFLVLGHGAGGSLEQLADFQRAWAPLGLRTLAFNFPYSEKGKKVPDSMNRLVTTTIVALRAAWKRLEDGERLIAGGRSMGGRVATHLLASKLLELEELTVDGLVLLGYPLHPIDKPDVWRTEHLASIEVPQLFVSGTRDELAPREHLAKAVSELDDATLHWIEGGDHGLTLRKKDQPDGPRDVAAEVARAILDWLP